MSFDTANMGKRKTKQKTPKPVCLRAQGADGGTKRTPLHVGDKAAGQQQYEVEAILQRARKYGIEHYRAQTSANSKLGLGGEEDLSTFDTN